MLALIVLFCLGPIVWQFLTSVTPTEQLLVLPPLLPTSIDLSHYVKVFEGRPFGRIMLNSAFVASATTLVAITIGSLAAYALAVLRVRGSKLFLITLLSISMFPPIATVSPLYLLIRSLGLRDTYFALIFPYATFALPLSIWVLANFFHAIPLELQDAARIDGCTTFQAFRRIFLPLGAPGISTAGILVFIYSWNEFLFALTFTSTEKSQTIPVGIALFPGLHEIPWGEIAAATMIVTFPLLLLVFFFQRRIVSGLIAGAVTG